MKWQYTVYSFPFYFLRFSTGQSFHDVVSSRILIPLSDNFVKLKGITLIFLFSQCSILFCFSTIEEQKSGVNLHRPTYTFVMLCFLFWRCFKSVKFFCTFYCLMLFFTKKVFICSCFLRCCSCCVYLFVCHRRVL